MLTSPPQLSFSFQLDNFGKSSSWQYKNSQHCVMGVCAYWCVCFGVCDRESQLVKHSSKNFYDTQFCKKDLPMLRKTFMEASSGLWWETLESGIAIIYYLSTLAEYVLWTTIILRHLYTLHMLIKCYTYWHMSNAQWKMGYYWHFTGIKLSHTADMW